jgi:hypothetical protein
MQLGLALFSFHYSRRSKTLHSNLGYVLKRETVGYLLSPIEEKDDYYEAVD